MKYSISLYVLLGFIILGMTFNSYGQTCSCAGAPLISSQSISSASKGNLFLGVTYQYNDISNLYTGSEKLINQSVRRNTQSTLFEVNYGITNRLTFSGTATFVQKVRESGLQNPGSENTLTIRGIGDGLFMLKYVLHKNTMSEQYQLAVGGGVKVPFGTTSLTQNGLTLNADMQPGTGAWDGVIWSYFSKTFAPSSTINAFIYSTYRRTGTNERFGNNDRYRFGNEWVTNAGITDTIIPDLSYIAMINYRSTASDQRNGQQLPNTGGKWINLEPALQYQIAQGLSAKASGKIPVYQYLNGIQPTTAYTVSLSVFYNFGNQVIF